MPDGPAHMVLVSKAVCLPSCPLSPEARHLVMVLATLADFGTGSGFSGKSTIAAALGKSERQVRRLIDVVNNTEGTPVRIEQQPRFRKEGRGRTSNGYQLVLTNRPPMTLSEHSTGHQRPPEQTVQPDTNVPMSNSKDGTSTAAMTSAPNQSTGHQRPREQTIQPDTRVPLKPVQPVTDDRMKTVQPDAHDATNRTPMTRLTGHPRQGILSPELSPKLSTRTPPNPTTQLRDFYVELFASVRGGPPDWGPGDHGRVGKAFKQLAESYGGDIEVLKGIIRAALLDEFSPITDPMVIFKQRDRFFGQQPRRKNNPAVRSAPQRGVASHVRTALAEDVFGGE